MSSAIQRLRRREEVDQVYGEVAKSAAWGALIYGAFGASVITIAHHSWPTFRRQTLAFKGFLTMGFVCTGLVFYGESTLLAHERETRLRESRLRKEARIDLARQGIVGTESEIAKWKEEKLKAMDEERTKQ